MEIHKTVWEKLEEMGHEAEEYCIDEMNMCVNTFENIGNIIEPLHGKTNNLRLRKGLTQTSLNSHRSRQEA